MLTLINLLLSQFINEYGSRFEFSELAFLPAYHCPFPSEVSRGSSIQNLYTHLEIEVQPIINDFQVNTLDKWRAPASGT